MRQIIQKGDTIIARRGTHMGDVGTVDRATPLIGMENKYLITFDTPPYQMIMFESGIEKYFNKEMYVSEAAAEYILLVGDSLYEAMATADNELPLTNRQLVRIRIEAQKGDGPNRITRQALRAEKKDVSRYRVTKHAKKRANERLPKESNPSTGNILPKISEVVIRQFAQRFINAADVMLDQIKEGEQRFLYLSDDGNVAISEMKEILTIYTKDDFYQEEGGWVISTLEVIKKCKDENKEKARQMNS